MGLFPVQRTRQKGFLKNGGRLNVFGDQVHDLLAAQIDLPVLFAPAENGFLAKTDVNITWD